MGLPDGLELQLVGTTPDALLAWSTPLNAPTVLLPQQQGFLTALLADEAATGHQARMLRIFGGSGGVGASTLAAGLAVRAAKQGLKVALVEADSGGGGVDLLFSAEQEPGWRWDKLASARGHIGELSGRLPQLLGVDLVAASGTAGATVVPDEALRAVLASLRRSHDLVVIDQGRSSVREGHPVAVVAAEVRGLAAAKARLNDLGAGVTAKVVLRSGPGWRLTPGLAAEVLGMPVLGKFHHYKRLPYDAEVGDPPGRARGALAANLDQLLRALLGETPLPAAPESKRIGVARWFK
jgi:secretion/DNA translocation related CpaE-like protein